MRLMALCFALLCFIILVSFNAPARAASQNDCAIWLCLPAGFPSGCSGAFDAFQRRIRKLQPPLPLLTSCIVSSGGRASDGQFQTGRTVYEACRPGYKIVENGSLSSIATQRYCVDQNCSRNLNHKNALKHCPHYTPARNSQPNWIRVWVDGAYLGEFTYGDY